ncbi:MAG TPA: hypothetical protein VNX40_08560 [Mucilaginibacter sp.]|jgi:hypothetical protein|nr:hypothetical protein [Mucilaginibacter sp.]
MKFFRKVAADKEVIAVKKGVIKLVSLYISDQEKQVIIAPNYKNDAGIYYEQETCTIVNYPLDYSLLGEEIIKNFDLFTLKDKNLRDEKPSDWPAYKASKLKTIKAFEKGYRRIIITGANESNITLVIEGVSQIDDDLKITASFVPSKKPFLIGKLVFKVYNACQGVFNSGD